MWGWRGEKILDWLKGGVQIPKTPPPLPCIPLLSHGPQPSQDVCSSLPPPPPFYALLTIGHQERMSRRRRALLVPGVSGPANSPEVSLSSLGRLGAETPSAPTGDLSCMLARVPLYQRRSGEVFIALSPDNTALCTL